MTNLADYTTLKVGGPARNFIEVSTEAEIIAALEAAGDSPVLIMGSGSNLLISDSGFKGTVIRITNQEVQSEVDACSGLEENESRASAVETKGAMATICVIR